MNRKNRITIKEITKDQIWGNDKGKNGINKMEMMVSDVSYNDI